MKQIQILYVGDKNSKFPDIDCSILSKYYTVNKAYLDLIGKTQLLRGSLQIIKSLLQSDVSITWTADIHAAYVVLLSKIFQKKSIVIVGGYEICNMPEINYGLQTKRIRGWISRWVLKNADAVIVPSEAYYIKAKELGVSSLHVVSNCSVIPNGSIERKMPVVVMVGSQYGDMDGWAALKGVLTYDAIAKAMPETAFFLIGHVDEKLRERCNSIIFTGDLEHSRVQELLSKSKVYCQLSYTESFGVALLEAIQFGCVPVVTNIDGMAELVGDNGYKIHYGDIDGGINAVKQAMCDVRDRTEIIYDQRNKYSKDKRGEGFAKVIKEVMK